MQSQGITLGGNATSFATTMVTIAGITKLPLLKKTRPTIDMSDLNSPNNWEEFEISKLKRGSELEFEYNTNESRMDALDTIFDAEAVYYFKITCPGFTKSIWFTGLMIEHDAGEGAVDAKVTGKFKIKTTSKVYWQASAPS